MKILDKYVAKSFVVGYVIAFSVLIGLRIIIELFVNFDEFTEAPELELLDIIKNMVVYYGTNMTLYFRDFAGMITMVAAAFSIGRMVRSNELVALMASGVSLRRVLAPIVFLSVLLTALLVVDQEFIIPPLSEQLARDEGEAGKEAYYVYFISDEKGSLIFARQFDVPTATLHSPTILLRSPVPGIGIWNSTGRISAESATYDPNAATWQLLNGTFIAKDSNDAPKPIADYVTDITPQDIPVRLKSEYKTLLSWSELRELAAQSPNKDRALLYSQMNFRVTDPIINLTMLMVCLPILLCRDPKAMKSAIMISFGVSGACLVTNFVCRMLATEVIFGRMMPELWAWIPVFIFLPLAFIELDSMKS